MDLYLIRICVLDANKLKDRTKWKSRYTRLFHLPLVQRLAPKNKYRAANEVALSVYRRLSAWFSNNAHRNSAMAVENERTILFLDDNHVINLAWDLVQEPSEAQETRIRGFFEPEQVDIDSLRKMGEGILPADNVKSYRSTEITGDLLAGASAIVFRRGRIDRDMIASCRSLKLIQRLGAGRDSIDLQAAGERGIQVSCLSRASLIRTAEHAFALILSLAKRIVPADARVRAGPDADTPVGAPGNVAYNWCNLTGLDSLHGRTLGIAGLGEIGKIIAKQAAAFGMKVIYSTRTPRSPEEERSLNATWRSLPALLGEADFVSVHLSDIDENVGIFDGEAFKLMKPGAYFINTSRGRLVDEDALYTALTRGPLAGAGLDVHLREPRPADKLTQLDNVILTPHIAGGSRLAIAEEIACMFDNIRAAFNGSPFLPHDGVVDG